MPTAIDRPFDHTSPAAMPARAGVGLKPVHYRRILDEEPDIGFFEIHAENYMGAGGPPHRYLSAVRDRYPLSLHGVGLSIGGAQPLDQDHLARLAELRRRYRPALFSEHLAWSSHGGDFLHDLLPLPYTSATIELVAEHIDAVQATLGCRMLLENPSTYAAFAESDWSEIDFIAEIVRRTGCGLLLDVNNVFVACTNQLADPERYIDSFPLDHVGEIHLAGHARQRDEKGRDLLIDSHDRLVVDAVWALYRRTIALTGPLPTLIEWDDQVPGWDDLHAEARRADRVMVEFATEAHRHVAAG